MAADDQKRMLRAAQGSYADKCKAFVEIQTGPNPLTKQEIAKLIKRNPERYGFLKGYVK